MPSFFRDKNEIRKYRRGQACRVYARTIAGRFAKPAPARALQNWFFRGINRKTKYLKFFHRKQREERVKKFNGSPKAPAQKGVRTLERGVKTHF